MDTKGIVNKSSLLYRIGMIVKQLRDSLLPVRGKNNRLSIKGRIIGLKKSINGNHNVIQIKDSTLNNCEIRIRGNGNRLIIEEGCRIGKGCSFLLEGNNNTIVIGRNTSMNVFCHLNASEHNTTIHIGEDCMLSHHIVICTSDAHPIYNQEGVRLNPAKDIELGQHVWVARRSVIMKGAKIGDGCVVGSHSMVNKAIPQNCLVVGMPARIVKENIHWTKEAIF